jgi:transcriptional regulator with XRE-family HTH domain
MQGDFVDWLIGKQGGMSGEKFAEVLGVSPASWSLIRRRLQLPSFRMVPRAFQLWPDEHKAICRALEHTQLEGPINEGAA